MNEAELDAIEFDKGFQELRRRATAGGEWFLMARTEYRHQFLGDSADYVVMSREQWLERNSEHFKTIANKSS